MRVKHVRTIDTDSCNRNKEHKMFKPCQQRNKNRLAKAQKPAWPSLFSAQQEKDEMDAFLDDIKDVEDKADVTVPQPFWKQDSWKHVGPLT